MSINIKSDHADRLARELATLTGESLTDAITIAVAERLERVLAAVTKLNWYAKPDEAVATASKSGRPILMFSTIGDPDGFA